MAGARFVPVDVTVVASPWNFPVAIPVGGVAAALAAGSAVILKPAPPAKRCAAELVAAFHEAGVPEDLVALAPLDDGDVSRYLVTHEGVDRVVLTGSYDTARLFRSWKPDMHLLGETSGKNAIIVTPVGRSRSGGARHRALGLRARGTEVLGVLPADPRRLGRDAPRVSRASSWMRPRRCGWGCRHPWIPRSVPSSCPTMRRPCAA